MAVRTTVPVSRMVVAAAAMAVVVLVAAHVFPTPGTGAWAGGDRGVGDRPRRVLVAAGADARAARSARSPACSGAAESRRRPHVGCSHRPLTSRRGPTCDPTVPIRRPCRWPRLGRRAKAASRAAGHCLDRDQGRRAARARPTCWWPGSTSCSRPTPSTWRGPSDQGVSGHRRRPAAPDRRPRSTAMAAGLRQVASLADPVGEVLDGWTRPNGLRIRRVRVPLGRGGHHLREPPQRHQRCRRAVPQVGQRRLPAGLVGGHRLEPWPSPTCCATRWPRPACRPTRSQLVTDTSHEAAVEFMQLRGSIDCLIPRGGPSLIRSILDHATVPYVIDGDGNCHVYVDESADLDMAARHRGQRQDASGRRCATRPSRWWCTGRWPTLFLPRVAEALDGVELVGDDDTRALISRAGRGRRRGLRHRVPRPEAVGAGGRLARRRPSTTSTGSAPATARPS